MYKLRGYRWPYYINPKLKKSTQGTYNASNTKYQRGDSIITKNTRRILNIHVQHCQITRRKHLTRQ
jgi:hypothetical protein